MPYDKDPKLYEPGPQSVLKHLPVYQEDNTERGTIGCYMAQRTVVTDGEVVRSMCSGPRRNTTTDINWQCDSVKAHNLTWETNFLLCKMRTLTGPAHFLGWLGEFSAILKYTLD